MSFFMLYFTTGKNSMYGSEKPPYYPSSLKGSAEEDEPERELGTQLPNTVNGKN